MESSSNSGGVIVSRQRMRIENPFTLKVGQVFTGFGIGCGLGIGVGRPINLGAIPVVNQIMGATRGATDAFSGVGRHVNDTLRKIGAKNIEAGIGCGVGFGHGFGVGLAVKPGVVHQIQSSVIVCQAMTKMMMKFGLSPKLSLDQGLIPSSLQSGMSSSSQNPVGSIMQLATKIPDQTSQGLSTDEKPSISSAYESFASQRPSVDASYGSRTEKVIGSFLQNPVLKEEESGLNESVCHRDNVYSLYCLVLFCSAPEVLKHQQVIEELMEENEKLRQIILEELKIPPSKLQTSYPASRSPCSDCLECRRKHRRR
ncbi:unnamed protein product [Thlaspi arvense]|uniref:Uncharacterized protein n=1 Tax=Thlaspi arvense TaxID=13288 RepID=A0AAU9SZT7_THLAR|nr:unnamed protein product [Thlaspi arvense]